MAHFNTQLHSHSHKSMHVQTTCAQVFMISYMLDRQGYLITNREVRLWFFLALILQLVLSLFDICKMFVSANSQG